MHRAIAIIGGGFSGVMLMRHLVAQCEIPCHITLYEANPSVLGLGLAYSTREPDHFLNVQAIKMGALADDHAHFFCWLNDHEPRWRNLHPSFAQAHFNENSFVPRMIYGEYLRAMLEENQNLAQANGHRVRFEFQSVARVSPAREVLTEDGARCSYDAVLLAMGHYGYRQLMETNGHPGALLKPWIAAEAEKFWQWFDAQHWQESSRVAVIGTGLSAVDMLHSLRRRNFPGRIIALSRHGGFPAVHRLVPCEKRVRHAADFASDADAFYQQLTQEMEAAGEDWRQVMDDLRPITNAIWQQFPDDQKQRFLQRYLSWWNPRRHRMANDSAVLLAQMQQDGRLEVVAAELEQGAVHADGQMALTVKSQDALIMADALISTTGFTYRLRDAGGSLVAALVEDGVLAASPIGVGLDCSTAGKVGERIYSTGPLRFGALLETTAVPELRVEAQEVAQAVLKDFSSLRA